MSRIFLRSYQQDAIDQIVTIFAALDALENSPTRPRRGSSTKYAEDLAGNSDSSTLDATDALNKRLKQRVTIVCAPTGSGKTLIMKGIADKLAELGVFALVLTYASPVAAQNRTAGLAASTIQKFFWAFETAAERSLNASATRRFVAQHIELPEVSLDDKVVVLVDESHLGLENMAQIYDKVLSFLSNARMIVGFTATPRWREYFNLIDLSPQVAKHVAAPRGSLIQTQWLGSLPQQALLFPLPMIVFARSVLAAAILTMTFRLSSKGSRSALIVANGRKAMEELVVRFLMQQSGHRSIGEPLDDDDEAMVSNRPAEAQALTSSSVSIVGYRRAELLHTSDPLSLKIDLNERRFGLIVMLLLLDVWSQLPFPQGAASLQQFGLVHGQIPRFALGMRLLKQHLPETARDVTRAITSGDLAAAARVARRAAAINVLQGVNPDDFSRGKIDIAVSVYKIATGFNLPGLRTVLFSERVMGSRVLYEQRAGRGARKFAGKKFYDLVEAQYLDPYSDAAFGTSGVSWRTIFLRDHSVRRMLAQWDLVFRFPCASWEQDEDNVG